MRVYPLLPSTASPSRIHYFWMVYRPGRTFSNQVETNLGGGGGGGLWGGVRAAMAAMANFWHSGGHITGVPALPLPCSIPQIPGMTEVLPYLSLVAALRVICTHSLE